MSEHIKTLKTNISHFDTSEIRYHNIIIYSMNNLYSFSVNSAIKLLAFLKFNFKWASDDNKGNLNVKIGEIR